MKAEQAECTQRLTARRDPRRYAYSESNRQNSGVIGYGGTTISKDVHTTSNDNIAVEITGIGEKEATSLVRFRGNENPQIGESWYHFSLQLPWCKLLLCSLTKHRT